MALQPWHRNLAIIFIAQFMAMTAFSFVDPLVPLYIQKLGNFSTTQAAFWSSVATFSMGLVMFLVSPVWGVIADRFGRKKMLLRAMFGGSLVMALIGLVSNPYLVVSLRGLQGLLSGSVVASTALSVTVAPRNRISFAIGMIMVAAFSGGSVGPFVGGFVADRLGYEGTFYISSGILLLSATGISFLIKEQFKPNAGVQRPSIKSMLKLATSKQMLPLLSTLLLLNLGPALVSPMISLLIADISPGGQAATAAGVTFSLMGVTAAASSLFFGRLGERFKLPVILVVCCIGAGIFYLPPVWAGSVTLLTLFLAMGGLFRGGISTSSSAIVGLSVSQGQEGVAYGLAQSVQSLGGGIGSLTGGSLATAIGIRPVFGVAAATFIFVGIYANRWFSRRPREETTITVTKND